MPYGRGGRIGLARGIQEGMANLGNALNVISQQQEEQKRYDDQVAHREKTFDYGVSRDQEADRRYNEQQDQATRAEARDWRTQGYDARVAERPDPGIINPTTAQGVRAGQVNPGTVGQSAGGHRPNVLAVGDEYNPDRDVNVQRSRAQSEAQLGNQMQLEDHRAGHQATRDHRLANLRGEADPLNQYAPGTARTMAHQLVRSSGNDISRALQALQGGVPGLEDPDLIRAVQGELNTLMDEAIRRGQTPPSGNDLFRPQPDIPPYSPGSWGGGDDPPRELMPHEQVRQTFQDSLGRSGPPQGEGGMDLGSALGRYGGERGAAMSDQSQAPDWFIEHYQSLAGAGQELPPLSEAWAEYQRDGGL